MNGESLTLGALIKIHRKEKDLSQAELSHGICATSYLRKVENGEIQPNEEIISLLLRALNIEYFQANKFAEEEHHFLLGIVQRYIILTSQMQLGCFTALRIVAENYCSRPLSLTSC